jgi:hypothetical protein
LTEDLGATPIHFKDPLPRGEEGVRLEAPAIVGGVEVEQENPNGIHDGIIQLDGPLLDEHPASVLPNPGVAHFRAFLEGQEDIHGKDTLSPPRHDHFRPKRDLFGIGVHEFEPVSRIDETQRMLRLTRDRVDGIIERSSTSVGVIEAVEVFTAHFVCHIEEALRLGVSKLPALEEGGQDFLKRLSAKVALQHGKP